MYVVYHNKDTKGVPLLSGALFMHKLQLLCCTAHSCTHLKSYGESFTRNVTQIKISYFVQLQATTASHAFPRTSTARRQSSCSASLRGPQRKHHYAINVLRITKIQFFLNNILWRRVIFFLLLFLALLLIFIGITRVASGCGILTNIARIGINTLLVFEKIYT